MTELESVRAHEERLEKRYKYNPGDVVRLNEPWHKQAAAKAFFQTVSKWNKENAIAVILDIKKDKFDFMPSDIYIVYCSGGVLNIPANHINDV